MQKNFILVTLLLLISCETRNVSELPEISVDTDQNVSLPLSEISEEINAIELELTDESIINPDRIIRILFGENHIVVAERAKILVFSMDGKFVRSIGSRGQGPGEYTIIRNLAMDEMNKLLFVISLPSKLICYDLDGNFLKESSLASDKSPRDISYIDRELLIVAEQVGMRDVKGLFQRSVVYTLNNEFQIIDSCAIRDVYFEKIATQVNPYENFIVNGDNITYLYYPDIYMNEQMPLETVLRDTLFSLKNNHLNPELKLKFKDNGIDQYGNKYIHLFNVYRSSQYVFAFYYNEIRKNNNYFCFNLKTRKGYNMQDGYTDDIHKIEERIKIRPLTSDSEYFYYWYTNMKSGDREEPNPTLYIGKLKK